LKTDDLEPSQHPPLTEESYRAMKAELVCVSVITTNAQYNFQTLPEEAERAIAVWTTPESEDWKAPDFIKFPSAGLEDEFIGEWVFSRRAVIAIRRYSKDELAAVRKKLGGPAAKK